MQVLHEQQLLLLLLQLRYLCRVMRCGARVGVFQLALVLLQAQNKNKLHLNPACFTQNVMVSATKAVENVSHSPEALPIAGATLQCPLIPALSRHSPSRYRAHKGLVA